MERADRVDRDLWWRLGLATVGALFRAAFRLRFEGLANIPLRGPALLACNHISVLDPPIVAMAPSERGRTVRFLTAAEFFDKPLIGWGLRRIRQIPIKRGASDWNALQETADVISEGALAGIFPEGGLGTGELLPGRRGVARIALAGGVPVIPAAIWGTHRRWPVTGWRWDRPLRMPVALVVGEPIAPEGDPRDTRAVKDHTDHIMDGIAACLRRAREVAGR